MSKTLVIQSSRIPFPYSWLEHCLASVRHWCEINQFEYQFIGDELFDSVPDGLLEKIKEQRVIATDLARLFLLKESLLKGFETVVWLDADFLIFDPNNFALSDDTFSVGREVWVQHNEQGKLKVYKKVHNAFLMFRQGNSFLNFYADTAERLLWKNQGGMPPQFIGPKLLTALHSVAALPVLETAGMLSPLVTKDILQGDGAALDMFIARSTHPISGANLCASSSAKGEVSDAEMGQLIEVLLAKEKGIPLFLGGNVSV